MTRRVKFSVRFRPVCSFLGVTHFVELDGKSTQSEDQDATLESRNISFYTMEDMSQQDESLILNNQTKEAPSVSLDTLTDWMTLSILTEAQMELKLDTMLERTQKLERMNQEWEMKYLGLKKDMSLRQRLLVGGALNGSSREDLNGTSKQSRETIKEDADQQEDDDDYYDPGLDDEEEDDEYAPSLSALRTSTCRKMARFSRRLTMSPGSPSEINRRDTARRQPTRSRRSLESAPVGECGVKEKERVPCPHCEKTYVDQRRLDKHLKDKHPSIPLAPQSSAMMDLENDAVSPGHPFEKSVDAGIDLQAQTTQENKESVVKGQTPDRVSSISGVKKRYVRFRVEMTCLFLEI